VPAVAESVLSRVLTILHRGHRLIVSIVKAEGSVSTKLRELRGFAFS
jgi:hypothetical protein